MTLLFAIAAFGTGIVAAIYWYKSGAIKLGKESDIDLNEWIATTMKAMKEAARLNKTAALWTAVSVACGGVAAILSAWPSN